MSTSISRRRFIAAASTSAGAVAVGLPGRAAADALPALAAEPSAQSPSVVSRAAALPSPSSVTRSGLPLADLGVLEAASLLQSRTASAPELLAACRARVDARNGPVSFSGSPSTINAFVRRYDEMAVAQALVAGQRLSRSQVRSLGPAPALTGIPLVLKDLYAVAGLGLTASSQVLEGHVAPGDSAVWSRLKANGMVLLGHSHTDEFAFLAVTPQCGNPWNVARITGGSSGGSAAALAARMVPAATGSDTLGSLRIPAAFCGVSSIKPTFGLVSAAGVIPLVWSLDHCGPLARSIADCSLLLSAMAGRDPADPSTDVAASPPALYPLTPRPGSRSLQGARIGVPRTLGGQLDPGPGEIYDRTQRELAALGATLVAVDEPTSPFSALDEVSFLTDAAAYHEPWFPSQALKYGSPARQILAATRARNLSGLEYIDLHRRRAAYQAAYRTFLAANRLDAVALPVSLADPPLRNDPALISPVVNPENSRLLTFPYSYLGFPVITIPGGPSSASSLPAGVQLVGAPFTEAALIQIGIDQQAAHPHYATQPPGLPIT